MSDTMFTATSEAVSPGDGPGRALLTTVVDAPSCGFRTIGWHAQHPMVGWRNGTMLVSLQPYEDEQYAKNVVAEILWGRGFEGDFQIVTHLT